eukprot:m.78281 g.78281  ORF g.78281 m.78281 type:complete len:63 (+) comp20741_c0_seq1:2968-3156(+)
MKGRVTEVQKFNCSFYNFRRVFIEPTPSVFFGLLAWFLFHFLFVLALAPCLATHALNALTSS